MIAYLAEGDSSLPKEHIEIFGEGKTFVIEDFRSAKLYAGGREKKETLRQQDKGQAEETRVACAVVAEGKPAPITLQELEATTRATFRIRDSLRTGQPDKSRQSAKVTKSKVQSAASQVGRVIQGISSFRLLTLDFGHLDSYLCVELPD